MSDSGVMMGPLLRENTMRRDFAAAALVAAVLAAGATARAEALDPSATTEPAPPAPHAPSPRRFLIWRDANQHWHVKSYGDPRSVSSLSAVVTSADGKLEAPSGCYLTPLEKEHVRVAPDAWWGGFEATTDGTSLTSELVFAVESWPPTTAPLGLKLTLLYTDEKGGRVALKPEQVVIGAKLQPGPASQGPPLCTTEILFPAKAGTGILDPTGKPTAAAAFGPGALAIWLEKGVIHVEADPGKDHPWEFDVAGLGCEVSALPGAKGITFGKGTWSTSNTCITIKGKGSIELAVKPTTPPVAPSGAPRPLMETRFVLAAFWPSSYGTSALSPPRTMIFVGAEGKHPDETSFRLAVPRPAATMPKKP
jgi:hypothetical protein